MHLRAGACVFALLLASVLAGRLAITPDQSRKLIAQGTDTQPSAVPWHVTIYSQPTLNNYVLVCGGTLVSPSFVLTAAHCFDNQTQSSVRHWKVALGNYKTKWAEHERSTQHIGVKRLISHMAYRSTSKNLEHDIALLELTKAAKTKRSHGSKITVEIAHIDLDNRLPHDTGMVAGRGLNEHRELSRVLQSIELPYVDRVVCTNRLHSLYSNSPNNKHLVDAVTGDNYCAGYEDRNMSVCKGDSGGGYITFDPDTSEPFVRGVVSADLSPFDFDNLRKCFSQLYTTFTNVTDTRYISWIEEQAPEILESTKCGAIVSSSHNDNHYCHLEAQPVECSSPMKWKTVAVVTCKEGYVLDTSSGGKMYAKCLSNGLWSETLATCVRDGTAWTGTWVTEAPARNSPGNLNSYIDSKGCHHVPVTRYSENGGIETKTICTCPTYGGGTETYETPWTSGGYQGHGPGSPRDLQGSETGYYQPTNYQPQMPYYPHSHSTYGRTRTY